MPSRGRWRVRDGGSSKYPQARALSPAPFFSTEQTGEALNHLPRTRTEAQEQGSRFYRGNPCKAGHGGVRYTSSGSCQTCIQTAARERYRNLPEPQKEAYKARQRNRRKARERGEWIRGPYGPTAATPEARPLTSQPEPVDPVRAPEAPTDDLEPSTILSPEEGGLPLHMRRRYNPESGKFERLAPPPDGELAA